MVRGWTIRRWRGAFRAAVLRDVRGATALEFALVAPVLIAMIVATFEIAVMYFAQQGLKPPPKQPPASS
jgi:Flp pilus assembly protein TadG